MEIVDSIELERKLLLSIVEVEEKYWNAKALNREGYCENIIKIIARLRRLQETITAINTV